MGESDLFLVLVPSKQKQRRLILLVTWRVSRLKYEVMKVMRPELWICLCLCDSIEKNGFGLETRMKVIRPELLDVCLCELVEEKKNETFDFIVHPNDSFAEKNLYHPSFFCLSEIGGKRTERDK